MINKSKIELEDIFQLKEDQVSENTTIEYKEKLPDNNDESKREFLADISSFANASGGDLIYGIKEEKGCPIEFNGIEIDDIDKAVVKFQSIIRDGVEPRLVFDVQPIKQSENNFFIVFRIKKSWIGPHRVTFRNHNEFYLRMGPAKIKLNTQQLRNAFNHSQSLIERIEKFQKERIGCFLNNDFPLPFINGAKIALHVIPLTAFDINQEIDWKTNRFEIPLIGQQGKQNRINLNGALCYYGREINQSFVYTQLYRNGIIEAVDGFMLNCTSDKLILSGCEKELVKSLENFLNFMKALDVGGPIAIFLTLMDVKGYIVAIDNPLKLSYQNRYPIDNDLLQLPSTIIESYDVKPVDILKPMFDIMWNACGLECSNNFDEEGN